MKYSHSRKKFILIAILIQFLIFFRVKYYIGVRFVVWQKRLNFLPLFKVLAQKISCHLTLDVFQAVCCRSKMENPRWRIRDRFSVRTPEQYYPHNRNIPLLSPYCIIFGHSSLIALSITLTYVKGYNLVWIFLSDVQFSYTLAEWVSFTHVIKYPCCWPCSKW